MVAQYCLGELVVLVDRDPMKTKKKTVVTGVFVTKRGTVKKCTYFTQKRWTCPWCWNRNHYDNGGKTKVGGECAARDQYHALRDDQSSACDAVVTRLGTKIIEVPVVKQLLKFEDNRGNPVIVATCGDNSEARRKGERCVQPCLTVSGTNVNTSSARAHVIHLTPGRVREVVRALQEGLRT